MSQPFLYKIETSVPSALLDWMEAHNKRQNPQNVREFILKNGENGLPILFDSSNPREIFLIDFSKSSYRQLVKTFGKHQLLSKSVGIPKGVQEVWDLTTGMGEDTWALASIGIQMKSFERHPLIAYFLKAALHAASMEPRLSSIAKNIQLFNCCFSDLKEAPNFEAAALFDPMFDTGERKSKPKKEMVFLHELVGSDPDQAQELEKALRKFHRVAVKRSPTQSPLWPNPQPVFEGRGVRFDAYLAVPLT